MRLKTVITATSMGIFTSLAIGIIYQFNKIEEEDNEYCGKYDIDKKNNTDDDNKNLIPLITGSFIAGSLIGTCISLLYEYN